VVNRIIGEMSAIMQEGDLDTLSANNFVNRTAHIAGAFGGIVVSLLFIHYERKRHTLPQKEKIVQYRQDKYV
jgi:hypothetical protein